jgi:hypothetical protein
MIRKLLVLTVVGIALVAGAAVRSRIMSVDRDDVITRVMWKDIYESPQELVADVDAIVLARMERSRPGRSALGDEGRVRVYYKLNDFTVERAVKGDIRPGARITIEQTAEIDGRGRRVGIDADGGDYSRGSRYLLFLKKQPDTSYYYVVSYQGRYEVRSGVIDSSHYAQHVHAHDAVLRAFHRQPLERALQLASDSASE